MEDEYVTKTIRLALLMLDFLDKVESLSAELKTKLAELIQDSVD